MNVPVWKVCIVRPRSRPCSFDVPYIFYSKFLKSRARNLQTFQSGECIKERGGGRWRGGGATSLEHN